MIGLSKAEIDGVLRLMRFQVFIHVAGRGRLQGGSVGHGGGGAGSGDGVQEDGCQGNMGH